MITLNHKKFAESDHEFDNSCVGYAKRYKRRIYLMDHNKLRIGFIANDVLGSATLSKSGKWWYSYATIPIIGEYDSYSAMSEEVRSLRTGFDGRPIYN